MNCNFPDCKKKAIYKDCFIGMSLCKEHKIETDKMAKLAMNEMERDPVARKRFQDKVVREIDKQRKNIYEQMLVKN